MIGENVLDKSKLVSELKEIHIELVGVYKNIFDYKYRTDKDFKTFIGEEHKENRIKDKERQAWNDNFCHRASYTLLNKILFIRICEDKGFMLNPEDYVLDVPRDPHIGQKLSGKGLQKWANLVTNYTLGELVRLAFLDMRKSYSNIILYKDDRYKILNFTTEQLSLKYLEGDEEVQGLVLEFEDILNRIVEKLDTNKFNFKNADGSILGDVYENFMDRETRKAIGQFYTPEFVIEYILKNTVAEADVVENPFVSVADISCGSGHFLIMAYDILRGKFISNLELLKDKYADEVYTIKRHGDEEELSGKDYWKEENIHYHLLKHCIYGADIDSFAVQLTTINLLLKDLDNFTDELNIIECDSLIKWEEDYDWQDLKEQLYDIKLLYILRYRNILGIEETEEVNRERAEEIISVCEFWSGKYDYVVGNPPYLGQKGNRDSFEGFKNNRHWKNFYERMQDVYYYFYARGIELVRERGKLGFITPPYWLTAKATQNLKQVMIDQTKLIQVYDFSDNKVFDDAQVNGSIFIFIKDCSKNTNHKILINYYDNGNNIWDSYISRVSNLDLGIGMWNIFISEDEKDHFNINVKKLGEFSTISPGIQSGCDKVSLSHIKKFGLQDCMVGEGIFILSEEEIKLMDFDNEEKKILKRIYKNSQIERYSTNEETGQYLIATNEITDISKYPSIEKHLYRYKKILNNRHRNFALKKADKEGKWFALQTYRPTTDFEGEKIITPYRSKMSRFSYSGGPFYGSVDIFYISINDPSFNIFYVLGILNSNLILFWLLKNCKKKGDVLELYTDPLSNIPIKKTNYNKQLGLSNLVMKIIELKKTYFQEDKIELIVNSDNIVKEYINMQNELYKLEMEIRKIEQDINAYVYRLYNIKDEEIPAIENYIFDAIPDLDKQNNVSITIISFDKLFNYLTKLIVSDTHVFLIESNNYHYINSIKNALQKNQKGFDKFVNVLKKNNITYKSLDTIKNILNSKTYTWNAYRKAKKSNKINKTFIKYYDNNCYGLAEWSDEIHKNYFLDAIKEYTETTPNEKKARDILKLFKDLDIGDKQSYIEVMEGMIKKAFK